MFRLTPRPLLVILAAGVLSFCADRKTVNDVRRANTQFLKAIESGKALPYFSPDAFRSELTEQAQCFPGTRPEMSQRDTVAFILQWLRSAPNVPPGTNAGLVAGDPEMLPDNDARVDGFSVFVIDAQRLGIRRTHVDDEASLHWLEKAVTTPGAKVATTLSVPKGLLLYALWQKKAGGTWKIIGFSPTCD